MLKRRGTREYEAKDHVLLVCNKGDEQESESTVTFDAEIG